MIDTLNDIDIVEEFATDEPLECDFLDEDHTRCPQVAAWSVLVSCCGSVVLFCQEHFDMMLEGLSEYDGFWCNMCGTTCCPPSSMILSATRIGG